MHRRGADAVLRRVGAYVSHDWAQQHATVLGLGIAGYAAADALMQRGASVTVLDSGSPDPERVDILRTLGVNVQTDTDQSLPSCDVVVVSPGLPPTHPWIQQAQRTAIPVWGEMELAWRMRPERDPAPWLLVTGTNGKTTTTLMLTSILQAGGARARAAGNIGTPLVDVVLHDEADVIAVEVSSHQLPFMYSVEPLASVCLNIANDHLDHFGSMEAYVSSKARVYRNTQVAAVYNAQDPVTEHMVREADVLEGCRAIGFTLGIPGPSMLGVVDDMLVDRAFVDDRAHSALELASIDVVHPAAPHNIANALAAAALARAYGVRPGAVAPGLRDFEPAGHRLAHVGDLAGVHFVNDSKATNTHAAQTAMAAYPSIVWIGGGDAKNQDFDLLIKEVAPKVRAAVLIGRDQRLIAAAIERHAPTIPVICISSGDTGAMEAAVQAAAELAHPGDTVLLAPGCASWDMFDNYAHRGDAFVAAVRRREMEL
jgi:UDP-N-acetylmuramoylalanine--D-glutamate ligase